jgi:hypothetical protein
MERLRQDDVLPGAREQGRDLLRAVPVDPAADLRDEESPFGALRGGADEPAGLILELRNRRAHRRRRGKDHLFTRHLAEPQLACGMKQSE